MCTDYYYYYYQRTHPPSGFTPQPLAWSAGLGHRAINRSDQALPRIIWWRTRQNGNHKAALAAPHGTCPINACDGHPANHRRQQLAAGLRELRRRNVSQRHHIAPRCDSPAYTSQRQQHHIANSVTSSLEISQQQTPPNAYSSHPNACRAALAAGTSTSSAQTLARRSRRRPCF